MENAKKSNKHLYFTGGAILALIVVVIISLNNTGAPSAGKAAYAKQGLCDAGPLTPEQADILIQPIREENTRLFTLLQDRCPQALTTKSVSEAQKAIKRCGLDTQPFVDQFNNMAYVKNRCTFTEGAKQHIYDTYAAQVGGILGRPYEYEQMGLDLLLCTAQCGANPLCITFCMAGNFLGC
jgi:hypothetical protein